MNKIAKFYKVSVERFSADGGKNYNGITLPQRATTGSAGYDFFAPEKITVEKGGEYSVASGIRCNIAQGYVLVIVPKSGLGIKKGLAIKNTVGIIDSDYFGADNEGHIIVCLVNNGKEPIEIAEGKAYAQGIFLPFGITEDDAVSAVRNGGFGSTEKTEKA